MKVMKITLYTRCHETLKLCYTPIFYSDFLCIYFILLQTLFLSFSFTVVSSHTPLYDSIVHFHILTAHVALVWLLFQFSI
jgi:hypothetical protein